MSNFFYDMNKRMAELDKAKEQLTEGAQPAVDEGQLDELSPELLARTRNAASKKAAAYSNRAQYVKSLPHQQSLAPERQGQIDLYQQAVDHYVGLANKAATHKDKMADKLIARQLRADLPARMKNMNKSAGSVAEDNMDEGSTGDYSAKKARAGKDIGKPGKQFAKIAQSAGERYGSKERGEKVAGAVLAKLRKGVAKEGNDGNLANNAKPYDKVTRGDVVAGRLGKDEMGGKAKRKGPVDEVKLSDLPVRQVKGRAYGAQPEEFDQDDQDEVQDKQPKKAGRPKGTGRKLGAKGPTGKSKLMKKDSIREGDIEVQDQGEYGMEGDAAKDDIHTLVRDARALEKILGDSDDLPEWVQAKLTKAQGMISAVSDYMQTQHERQGEGEMPLREKAVSVSQRRAAGIAHAAQKGEIPKSKLRGASKEMAKMPAKELKKFAKTKEKGLPEKKGKEEVEETTTSGSVATAPAGEAKKSKGGMQFGKGIYDSMNRDLEAMIAESMSVNINSSTEGGNSVTVTATDEDAAQLMQMLRAAGIGSAMQSDDAASCPTCGQAPCGCAEVVDENQPDWPTDEVTSDDALQYSGGLNKPKSDVAGDGQTTVPVTAVRVQEVDQEIAESTCNMTAEGEMCPKHGMAECGMYEDEQSRILELAGIREAKPDFLDLDRDGNKTEPMKNAAAEKDEKLDEVLPAIGAALARTAVGSGASALTRGAASLAGQMAGKALQDKLSSNNETQAFESSLRDMNRLWKAYKAQ